MNIQIITSSYPAFPDDPTAAAGLFVRAFALELKELGHRVVIQPVARKSAYTADPGLVIEPLSWHGGDQELASLPFWAPRTWWLAGAFFCSARSEVLRTHQRYDIDRILCMWAIPAGLLGCWLKRRVGTPCDVWVLGSDLWKIRRIPLLGRALLRTVFGCADWVFADGPSLCREVEAIAGRECGFLPSSRELPSPRVDHVPRRDGRLRLLFVGRYHHNKGPDLLLQALGKLAEGERERLELRMYGVGPLKPELMSLATANNLEGVVKIADGIGARDLADELAWADYLAIPSRIESIPVIFSDALQTGTPVIATPVGDLPGLVNEHRCGLVAATPTAAALAEAVRQALDSAERDFLAANALHLARQFRPEAAARRWLPGEGARFGSGRGQS